MGCYILKPTRLRLRPPPSSLVLRPPASSCSPLSFSNSTRTEQKLISKNAKRKRSRMRIKEKQQQLLCQGREGGEDRNKKRTFVLPLLLCRMGGLLCGEKRGPAKEGMRWSSRAPNRTDSPAGPGSVSVVGSVPVSVSVSGSQAAAFVLVFSFLHC